MEIWNEYVDDEDREKIKEILDTFNRVIDDLWTLADVEYITEILQSSPYVRKKYFSFNNDFDGLEELSLKFENMRNILFGDNLDWEEVSKTLEKGAKNEVEVPNPPGSRH